MNATARTKRFLRSEDGQTWEIITPSECRRKLRGYYRDVDAVINAMTDGQPVRTPFAAYKLDYPAEANA